MPASLRSRLDLAQLSEQLTWIGRTRSRKDLADALIGILRETLGLSHVLVVLLDLRTRRPTVFGGSFEERRRIGTALRNPRSRGAGEFLDLASILGRGVRVVPVRSGEDHRGLVLIGSDARDVDPETLEYVRFLADRAAETLSRQESEMFGRVLCIDGGSSVLSLLRTVIERDGYGVTAARDPRTGAEIFVRGFRRGLHYQLVVIEIGSDREASTEAVGRIRAIDPEIPIIALAPGDRLPSGSLGEVEGVRVLTGSIEPIGLRLAMGEMLAR